MFKKPIRVVVIDSSVEGRRHLVEGLQKDAQIQVVGMAANFYNARDLIDELQPDVITLDAEIPRMNRITFLKRFMPIPKVIINSLSLQGLAEMDRDIISRIKIAANVQTIKQDRSEFCDVEAAKPPDKMSDKLIAIGASTGGVDALCRILPTFPVHCPGIVIVQHMPIGFTSSLADRLNGLSKMFVKEAEDGDIVLPGRVYLAPGGLRHMTIVRFGNQYKIKLTKGSPVNHSCPSVDVLFSSVALHVGANASAAILTGMGKDGAKGLLDIRRAGGATVAQDEATSVVFGMPHMANKLGGAKCIAALDTIPSILFRSYVKSLEK